MKKEVYLKLKGEFIYPDCGNTTEINRELNYYPSAPYMIDSGFEVVCKCDKVLNLGTDFDE